MRAGNEFLNQPTDTPFIPSWRYSAVPDIYDQLVDAVDEDMEIYKPKSVKPINDSPQKIPYNNT